MKILLRWGFERACCLFFFSVFAVATINAQGLGLEIGPNTTGYTLGNRRHVWNIDPASLQQWIWRDSNGFVRTRSELYIVTVRFHNLAEAQERKVTTNDSRVSHFNPSKTKLSQIQRELLMEEFVRGHLAQTEGSPLAYLSHSDLRGLFAPFVDFRWATLDGTALTKSHLDHSMFSNSSMREVNLSNSYLAASNFNHSDLSQANLSYSVLGLSNLSHVMAYGANFSHAFLGIANLSNATLSGANFTSADLTDADCGGAFFDKADLADVIFEPKILPNVQDIAGARNLSHLTWRRDPRPMIALRKSLSDSHYGQAAKEVTAAIHRHGQNQIEMIIFDWTCEWGANWRRPLIIMLMMTLICSFMYWVGMHGDGSGGLYLIYTGERVAKTGARERLRHIKVNFPEAPKVTSQQLVSFIRKPSLSVSFIFGVAKTIRRELNIMLTAILFSLMSLFNIGFREVNFGRWIRMLFPRDFDIRARGWMRTVSGIQSLLGVAMLVLSLLSYFGHPFD